MTVPANNYPTDIAKPTTPDEEQELAEGIVYHTWFKGSLTRSEIYERQLPDGLTGALRINGPEGNSGFMTFKSDGSIVLRTGKRNKEQGAGTGKLNIHTHGTQQTHEQKSFYRYNKQEGDKEALNVLCYGDHVEQCIGSERHIRAKKIIITADEELMLIGKTQVFIQSGPDGGGTITMNAGSVEKITSNDKEVIIGQKLTLGVSEETKLNFDPRSSVNIVSPGHVNWSILGDYSTWVGGIEEHIIAGGPGAPPLIVNRTSAFTVKTAIGGQTFDAADYINAKAGGAISDIAGGAATYTAGAAVDIKAGAAANIEAGAAVGIKAGATVDVTATGIVNIKGALIKLN